ncbi:hypothetical protein [Nocardioides terrisoli]|uniref:hypothetical protein n=1 Tax=Nocardioides terrisoli TaxID=3388267 RepID=UPI00287B5ECF|nr:hypothetical protein [Nocardioides marmorisolisilvae]
MPGEHLWSLALALALALGRGHCGRPQLGRCARSSPVAGRNQQVLGSDRPDWPLTVRDGFHLNVSVRWASVARGRQRRHVAATMIDDDVVGPVVVGPVPVR